MSSGGENEPRGEINLKTTRFYAMYSVEMVFQMTRYIKVIITAYKGK